MLNKLLKFFKIEPIVYDIDNSDIAPEFDVIKLEVRYNVGQVAPFEVWAVGYKIDSSNNLSNGTLIKKDHDGFINLNRANEHIARVNLTELLFT